jgi:uncharacterized protein RhaS with RHS repeats
MARWLSEDPIASDWNPYRYVRNAPPNATDPSGLRDVVVTIRYDFNKMKLTPELIKEFDRVMSGCFKSLKTDKVQFFCIPWSPAFPRGDDKSRYCWTKTGGEVSGVEVWLDDAWLGSPGQTAGNQCGISPDKIRTAAELAGKSFDIAAAASTAHEVGFHVRGWRSWHYHDTGFVDAASGGQIGANFSPEACDRIKEELQVK